MVEPLAPHFLRVVYRWCKLLRVQLYPHQRQAVAWLRERSHAVLADDMGLGKTATSLVAAVPKMLCVVPAVTTWNWGREVGMWRPRLSVQLVVTGKDSIDEDADVVIVSHGLLSRVCAVRSQIAAMRWETLIVDEAHMFRNRTAVRSRVLFRSIVGQCARVWLLTGTPMPNNPVDLWMLLRGILPADFPESWRAWRDQFCVLAPDRYDPSGSKVVGAKNTGELRRRVRPHILRRKKSDVLDLPRLRYESVSLRPMKWPAGFEELRNKVNAEAGLLDAMTPEEAYRALLDSQHFSTYAKTCGLAKIDPVCELLQQELAFTSHKVVIFARHLDVVAGIEKGLVRFGSASITGSVSSRGRQSIVDEFQDVGSGLRVLVCQIQAGGVGITLTAATDAVFAELSFTPGDNSQARDRIYRIGQERPVRVRTVSLEGTVDSIVATVLSRKLAMQSEAGLR